MTQPFKGKIDLDVRNAIPAWEPYEEPKARKMPGRKLTHQPHIAP